MRDGLPVRRRPATTRWPPLRTQRDSGRLRKSWRASSASAVVGVEHHDLDGVVAVPAVGHAVGHAGPGDVQPGGRDQRVLDRAGTRAARASSLEAAGVAEAGDHELLRVDPGGPVVRRPRPGDGRGPRRRPRPGTRRSSRPAGRRRGTRRSSGPARRPGGGRRSAPRRRRGRSAAARPRTARARPGGRPGPASRCRPCTPGRSTSSARPTRMFSIVIGGSSPRWRADGGPEGRREEPDRQPVARQEARWSGSIAVRLMGDGSGLRSRRLRASRPGRSGRGSRRSRGSPSPYFRATAAPRSTPRRLASVASQASTSAISAASSSSLPERRASASSPNSAGQPEERGGVAPAPRPSRRRARRSAAARRPRRQAVAVRRSSVMAVQS